MVDLHGLIDDYTKQVLFLDMHVEFSLRTLMI